MQTAEETRKLLKAKGLRATPQRLLVLQALEESAELLDAEAIRTRGRGHDPRPSLATVYRTVNKLEEIGLVKRCTGVRCHRRAYYIAASREVHDHFVCMGCGKLIEVQTPCLAQASHELFGQSGAVVTSARIYLEGYCAECAAQANLEPVES